MDFPKILFNKEGFKFSAISKNNYKLEFTIENNNIILSQIIDFSLIKLIYDLNADIYEKVNLEKINDNEAIITLVMKHLFEDIGLPQRFSFFNMKKTYENKKIIFEGETIMTHIPEGMPENAELLPMKKIICTCNIITPHKIEYEFNICFDNNLLIPEFLQKMIGVIINKIFKRVKQFIENLRL
jgi:hypothetical protein